MHYRIAGASGTPNGLSCATFAGHDDGLILRVADHLAVGVLGHRKDMRLQVLCGLKSTVQRPIPLAETSQYSYIHGSCRCIPPCRGLSTVLRCLGHRLEGSGRGSAQPGRCLCARLGTPPPDAGGDKSTISYLVSAASYGADQSRCTQSFAGSARGCYAELYVILTGTDYWNRIV